MAWVDIEVNINNGAQTPAQDKWVDTNTDGSYNPTIEEQFKGGINRQVVTPQTIAQGQRVEPNEALESSALDPLENALIGKLAEPVINGAIGLYHLPRKALLGTNGKTAKEISDLQNISNKHGVELTPASLTGSPSLARVENSINDGFAGSLGMRQAVNAEKSTIDDAIIKRLERMGADGSNINAGETFTKSVNNIISSEKQYFKDGFSNLFAKYGDDAIFSIRGVKAEAQKLVQQAERNPIIKNTTAYRDAKALTETADDLSWADWSQLRTQLGGLTQDGMVTGKASTGAYKNMYSKLEGDLVSTVSKIGDNQTMTGYRKLIDEYKQFKDGFDGRGSGARFINSLEKGTITPEAVGHTLNNSSIKARGASSAGGFDIKTGLPNAKKVGATDTLISSKAPNSDDISLNRFIKYSDKDGFKALAKTPSAELSPSQKLFSGTDDVIASRAVTKLKPVDDADVLSDLRTIAKSVVAKDSYKNTSKTAIYNQMNTAKTDTGKFLNFFATDALLSMAYRAKWFKKWLNKGSISKEQYTQLMKARTPSANKAGVATNMLLGSNKDEPTAKSKLGL